MCRLEDGTLCNIEFQYPNAKNRDLNRIFNYNITAQSKYQCLSETVIFNFTEDKGKTINKKIGYSKSFHPKTFYLGDVDFGKYIHEIKTKVKSKQQLTSFEEITLMLVSLNYENKSNLERLKKIRKLLENKKLFNESRYEYIESVIKLEIENLLTEEKQKEIEEEIELTPKAESIIEKAFNEVNGKVISEAKLEARLEGYSEGRNEGYSEGKKDAMIMIAKNLREKIDIEELSSLTCLTESEIREL